MVREGFLSIVCIAMRDEGEKRRDKEIKWKILAINWKKIGKALLNE